MAGVVRALSRDECLARLAGQRLARVSMSKAALPVIVPVVYTKDAMSVMFSAPLDEAFAQLCDRSVIAFQVDDASSSSSDVVWSVQLVGMASAVHAGNPGAEQLVRVNLRRVSGHTNEF